MRYSQLFGKTTKQSPKDELTINAQLLTQAGYVNKLMAGVYSYLPLGLRVMTKIENIIREEMNKVGGQEIFLPGLHPSEIWKQTGGWEHIDVLFKIKSRTEKDYALGQSHEEVITPLVKTYIKSYKDLPIALYQIQQKYRDELRAKSGLLRGREFRMKDMYSWHRSQEDFERFYSLVKEAYLKIFERCGLVSKVTEASGGNFSQKISYEFMVLTDAGEDDILYCEQCAYCVNVEIAKTAEGNICPACGKGALIKARAVEAANVFDLGTKYTKDFDMQLLDEEGKPFHPIMGCYGIGISRLMGVVVEKYADDKGLVWPSSITPYRVHLILLGKNEKAEKLYHELREKNIEVLFDDREVSAGEKFRDADLIGIPLRAVISERTLDKIEVKKRKEQNSRLVSHEEFLTLVS